MNEIKINIDNQSVIAKRGMSVLEAARMAGIYIPSFCYNPELSIFEGCRVCMTEINGELLTACRTLIEDGMTVWTDTPSVSTYRKMAVEMILAHHNQDCQSCAKNNSCNLQKVSAFVGIDEKRLSLLRQELGQKSNLPIDESNPFFNRDFSKCLSSICGTCVRTCDEINGASALVFESNSSDTISAFRGENLFKSKCESCGECVERCPTGAMYKKEFELPSYEVRTICPYCGTGCAILYGVRGDRIVSARGDVESPVNKGHLCIKGRFGFDFVNHKDRLTTPLIKKDDIFVKASWDEALDLIVEKFREIIKKHGPESLGGLSSAKCTNEDNYLFQKLLRSLGTNSVDHCARLCHAATVVGLSTVLGSAAMTNPISDIIGTDVILVFGCNPVVTQPIIGYRIRNAVKKGAKLIVVDPRCTPLTNIADIHLRLKPGTNIALVNGMMYVILKEGLEDSDYIKNRTNNFENMQEMVEKYTPEYVSKITEVSAKDVVKAARLYASAENASIFYSMGVTQHSSGTENVVALTNLALATGNIGKPHTGINPLRGQNNVQGACDMGCLPNVLPGYQPLYGDSTTYWQRLAGGHPYSKTRNMSDEIRKKFSQSWGVELSDVPGRTISDMFNPNPNRWCKAMYIMGENPMLSDPNTNHVRECLKSLDFLVVQDIFLTETAQFADVVLPASSFAEKDGTFINTERRVQRVRKVINPRGESKSDWEIIQNLAQRFGFKWNYSNPEDIWDEMRELTPHYFGGMSYKRLDSASGLQWPCPTEDHPGTPIMHKDKFARGIGQFSAVEYRPLANEETSDEYPFILTTARKLNQFHTRTMTGKTEGLNKILGTGFIEINPIDAKNLSLNPDDKIKLISRRGWIESKILITDSVSQGVVCGNFHFKDMPINTLTNPAICNMSVTPSLKVSAVRIEKIACK